MDVYFMCLPSVLSMDDPLSWVCNVSAFNVDDKWTGWYWELTQFKIEVVGLVQGVTKLMIILLSFVTFIKTTPIELTKNGVDSSHLGKICCCLF